MARILFLYLDTSCDCIPIPNNDLELHEEIGAGAFGKVFRATWKSKHYIIAVKRLHIPHLNDKDEKNFFKELSILNKIRCPNIISCYGACTETGNYALIMEYMALGSLYKILHQDKRILTWSERLSIALQTASGIHYLHTLDNPILHRDIKSSNCLIQRSYDGYVAKLCDFGLAKTKKEITRQTQSKSVFAGTPQWTAPEVLQRNRYTEKADIYGLGVVYWELASNKRPYEEFENVATIYLRVVKGERLEIPGDTPADFKVLIKKCWSKDPDKRPCSDELVRKIQLITLKGNYLVVSRIFNQKALNAIPCRGDTSSPA